MSRQPQLPGGWRRGLGHAEWLRLKMAQLCAYYRVLLLLLQDLLVEADNLVGQLARVLLVLEVL